jgi:hypothetical protein
MDSDPIDMTFMELRVVGSATKCAHWRQQLTDGDWRDSGSLPKQPENDRRITDADLTN